MQRWGRCLLKGGATRYAYDECIQLDAPYKIGPPNAETETRNSQTRNRLDNRCYVVWRRGGRGKGRWKTTNNAFSWHTTLARLATPTLCMCVCVRKGNS